MVKMIAIANQTSNHFFRRTFDFSRSHSNFHRLRKEKSRSPRCTKHKVDCILYGIDFFLLAWFVFTMFISQWTHKKANESEWNYTLAMSFFFSSSFHFSFIWTFCSGSISFIMSFFPRSHSPKNINLIHLQMTCSVQVWGFLQRWVYSYSIVLNATLVFRAKMCCNKLWKVVFLLHTFSCVSPSCWSLRSLYTAVLSQYAWSHFFSLNVSIRHYDYGLWTISQGICHE